MPQEIELWNLLNEKRNEHGLRPAPLLVDSNQERTNKTPLPLFYILRLLLYSLVVCKFSHFRIREKFQTTEQTTTIGRIVQMIQLSKAWCRRCGSQTTFSWLLWLSATRSRLLLSDWHKSSHVPLGNVLIRLIPRCWLPALTLKQINGKLPTDLNQVRNWKRSGK